MHTLDYQFASLIRRCLKIELIFYKKSNFRNSDSMSDYFLTMFIEFSIKSYVNSGIPGP